MILLSVNDSLQFANSTTDWLQSLDIVVVIVIAIISACYLLYNRHKDNEEKKRKRELEEQDRKLSIRPKFEIKSYYHDPNENTLALKLIVRDGSARFVNIEGNQSNLINIITGGNSPNDLIGCNEYIVLRLSSKSINPLDLGRLELDFKVVYKDIENNIYTQLFEGAYSNGIKIHNPKEINESI